MKKVIYVLFFILLLSACGTDKGSDSNLTLDDYQKAFEEAGFVVDEEKPAYTLIGAKNGFIIHEGGKVAIYEFESEKGIKEAEEALPVAKEWDRNGRFLLETSVEEAKTVFKGVK